MRSVLPSLPRFALPVLVVLVFAGAFVVTDGLRFEAVRDEVHFLETARGFAGPFGLEALRDYPEVVTPLALVVWGQLERLTGDGLFTGRLLNLLVGLGLLLGVGRSAPRTERARAEAAALGLVCFPYLVPLSVHLYTDVLGAALAVLGVHALLRDRAGLAFLAFAGAVATRQYMVQIPAAFLAVEGLAWLAGERQRLPRLLACAGGVATLLGWFAFFGGLAPAAGVEAWVLRYPAPMMEPTEFLLHYGLYALTGLGVYFVFFEAVLFRPWPALADLRGIRPVAVAGVLLLLFGLDPPLLREGQPGGPIGRVARLLLPAPEWDGARMAVFYLLALATALRFTARLDAGFWVVAAGFVLAMKQQIPWEKYLLPTVATLWYLRAAGALPLYGRASSDPRVNGLRKQAEPSEGLST